VKQYCELLLHCGEYDRALAAAPAVSFSFWQELMLTRSILLKNDDNVIDFEIIRGKSTNAIHLIMGSNTLITQSYSQKH
jgi:hypothetical protein